MRILFVISFFIVNIILLNNNLLAQKMSSPLDPPAPERQLEAGVLLGLGYNFMSGEYQPLCDSCLFTDGGKFGYSIGFVIQRDFNKYLQWGATFNYISKSINSSYIVNQPVELYLDDTLYDVRPFQFENVANFNINALSLQPFLQWAPETFMFVRLGFGIGIVTSTNITHTQELLKFTDTLATGERVYIKVNGKDPKLGEVENREIEAVIIPQFSIEPALGFNFEIGKQIFMSPYFQYSFPLSNFSSKQNDFVINNWRIVFEIRLVLKLRDT